MKILIIEDNPDIIANLYDYFEPLGHVLDNTQTGYAGLARAEQEVFDIIILDGMLPGMDGLEVCKRIRIGRNSDVPILMLTARDTTQDKANGLYAGAVDYLVKPYSLIELEARIIALHRRAGKKHDQNRLVYGDIKLDTGMHVAKRCGNELNLPPLSFKLLAALIRSAPNVLTREQMAFELWGDDPPMSDALRSHVHLLRQAIDKAFPDRKPMLINVQGIGYRLAARNEEA